SYFFICFFFFQAEDGIRDDLVTGVQTCALPISNFQMRLIQPKDAPEFLRRIQSVGLHTRGAGADNIRNLTANPTAGIDPVELIRSEERRVGKECRMWGEREDVKKKQKDVQIDRA